MSRVLPVLFNTEMVRATLEGRRSCISLKIPIDIVNNCDVETDGTLLSYENNYGDFIKPVKLCQYQPGDILYVRETWKKAPNGYYYYEDWQRNDIADITKWKPSIHMPKEAARIWLNRAKRIVRKMKMECAKNVFLLATKLNILPTDPRPKFSRDVCWRRRN